MNASVHAFSVSGVHEWPENGDRPVPGVPGAEVPQDADQRVGVLQTGEQRAEGGPEPVLLFVQVLGEEVADAGIVLEQMLVEVPGDGGAMGFDGREPLLARTGSIVTGPDSAERSR
ncbi:hypothetical protein OG535_18920 [Kitasatospora sp. NBC_00085]|uniref:hypothetical protein n=1 Tax=Kitasatospora sp. NBC_00085 TaxID=2903566 RepID=UPI003251A2D1